MFPFWGEAEVHSGTLPVSPGSCPGKGVCIVVLWWKVGVSLCVPKQQWSPCQGLALGGLMPAVVGPLARAWLCN